MRTLLAISLSVLVGCATKATPAGVEQARPTTVSEGVLANVPADTPYFTGSSATGGRSLMDHFVNTTLAGYAPVVERVNAHLDDSPDEIKSSTAREKLMFAVFRELRGRLSEKGLLELGIDLARPYAVFGLGYFPALRLELADASKFKAAIERVLASAGGPTGKKTIGGFEYWRFDLKEDDLEFSLVFALDKNQISAAVVSLEFAEVAAAFVTGKERPTETLADSKLAERMAQSYGVKVDGLGMIDTARLLSIATGQTADVGKTTAQFMDRSSAQSDACLSSLRGLAAMFPRVVWGNTVLDAKRHAGGLFLEMSESVAMALGNLQTPMPDLSRSKAPLVLGFGIDGGAAYSATVGALDQLSGLSACAEDRRKATDNYAEAKRELANLQQAFSMVGGVSLAIDDLQLGEDGKSMRAVFAAFVNNASLMHSMLGLALPISLPPPGDSSYPIELPLPNLGIDVGRTFFDFSDTAVGISVGHDSPAALSELVARRSSGAELMVFEATGDILDSLSELDEDEGEDGDEASLDPELDKQLAGLDRSEYKRIRITAVVQKRALAFLFDATFR